MIDDSEKSELSFVTLMAFVRRHRYLILLCVFLCTGILVVTRFTRSREYTTFASFIPGTSQSSSSSAASLAAQFGFGALGVTGARSPDFFSDLVTSPTVIRQVVTGEYAYTGRDGSRTRSLVDIYASLGDTPAEHTPAERVDAAMHELEKHISTHVSPKTGLITLNVSAPRPDLAVQLAERIIAAVNTMNLRLRQEEATAQRQFTEQRMAELAKELSSSEDRLQAFMQNNRDYSTSSRLQLEQQRLSRDAAMRQTVYETMASSYEQARIEAARNSPVIEVVDYPMPPARPDSRGLVKWTLGGVMLGVLLGFCLGGLMDLIKMDAVS